MDIRQTMAAIWNAVEVEQQDEQEIMRLVNEVNACENCGVMISVVRDPDSGRIEIIPMEK